MLILLINALGFPVNNFDPNLGDTFKTFYYSPFIVLSFVFLLENIKSKKKFLNVLFIILYLSISIFIIGFPKEDTVNYLSEINERNTHSVLCETNKILINDINFSGDCSEKILEFCKFNSDRKGYETTVKNSYDLENSIFMIKKMITKIDNQEINDFSCKTGQKSRGLLDFSTLPKLNLFLLMSFFLLIFTQKKKYSKV